MFTSFSIALSTALITSLYSMVVLAGAGYPDPLLGLQGRGSLWKSAFMLPAVYGVVFYVGIAVACWSYNAAARQFGGIQFEFSKSAVD
ncbi:MAG: hypothetical protein AB8G17_14925 [Gammaproteobacteria bacterium]